MRIKRNRPPPSLNEIRSRARQFAADWRDAKHERQQAQSFWMRFFEIFGMRGERVSSFEESAKREGKKGGFIDLLYPGHLLVEHKSAGEDLDKAMRQAMEYLPSLSEEKLPKYVVVCDFARFLFRDLRENKTTAFDLAELPDFIELFGFIAGYEKQNIRREDPVNEQAAELMAGVYDELREANYGEDSAAFLVRVLFCLFADDTGIFERGLFSSFIRERTAEDGGDLGEKLNRLFEELDKPENKRMKNLDEHLARFPFVDGALFSGRISTASFDSALREKILRACDFDWSKISPAVFGSLFQYAMDAKTQRDEGRHYTSEDNILKIAEPLFLDKLHADFAAAKAAKSRARLEKFHKKLAALTFLDPACGCGNFLIVAYREVRRLELELLREMYPEGTQMLDLEISALSKIDVDSFYGIELDDFSTRIAEVALWLTDHQMNRELSAEFGDDYRRIPLKKQPNIKCANALTMDWNEVVPQSGLSYILGNPPFVGKDYLNERQRAEMEELFGGVQGAGNLDYVSAWYLKAARYMQGADMTCAFVSTNSIAQGQQVAPLWRALQPEGVRIHFAHRTFGWESKARGAAHVHVIIVGFGVKDAAQKLIYEYDTPKSAPHKTAAANINGYLADAADVIVESRTRPLSPVLEMVNGSKAADGGNLILTDKEKEEFLRQEPAAEKFLRPYLSAFDFINNVKRWCLWLADANPAELRKLPRTMARIEAVRDFRAKSKKAATRALAEKPMLFVGPRQPKNNYLLVPRVSSEQRQYVPVGYIPANVIVSDAASAVPNATHYEFGVITSAMHMAWMRAVGGRLKSDYRYSVNLVYNTFPWPTPTAAQKQKIAECAESVLAARANYPGSSLADLYNATVMPPDLLDAHRSLDKAVDRAYRAAPFKGERARLEYLFAEYQKLAHPALPPEKRRRKIKRRKA